MSKEATGIQIEARYGTGSAYLIDGGSATVRGLVREEAPG